LLAVGLIPLPAATDAQIGSRTALGTFGRPIVFPAVSASARPARIAGQSFERWNSSITFGTVNAEPRLVSSPDQSEPDQHRDREGSQAAGAAPSPFGLADRQLTSPPPDRVNRSTLGVTEEEIVVCGMALAMATPECDEDRTHCRAGFYVVPRFQE
jgi:hypothetical protein